MQIIIHRGTHQIGGVATEIRTGSARILIDMGEELSLDKDFEAKPLSIAGVTGSNKSNGNSNNSNGNSNNSNGNCDAILISHNHGDHIGQLSYARKDIPVYLGTLAKQVSLATVNMNPGLKQRIKSARMFEAGKPFRIGNMTITPLCIDHSACDSYMFLIEADGKRVLHTGDFRLHGFRGAKTPKLLDRYVGKVDLLITEGTTISRPSSTSITEREVQQRILEYMENYKYVFVLCASTNLERICGMSKVVPRGKYFVCDKYQDELIGLIENQWESFSPLYRNIKRTVYGDNLHEKLMKKGFLMLVRDNQSFRKIIKSFPKNDSIMIYSMWDGYRTKESSTIPEILELAGDWKTLHASGHTDISGIEKVASIVNPDIIIPIHTENPDLMKKLLPKHKVVVLNDKTEFTL